MTPTIHRPSARAVRLLELGRQIAVDFQPDADFDECRRCPGHRDLPSLGQCRRQTSPYPAGPRIQEIRTIAFVYGRGLRLRANRSACPAGIASLRTHAFLHDRTTWLADGSLQPLCRRLEAFAGPKRRPIENCARTSAYRADTRIDRQYPGISLEVVRMEVASRLWSLRSAAKSVGPVATCLQTKAMASTTSRQSHLGADPPCVRSTYLASARPSKSVKG